MGQVKLIGQSGGGCDSNTGGVNNNKRVNPTK